MKSEKQYARGTQKRGGGHGPGFHSIGMPGEKPKNFKETTKRLIQYLKPHMIMLIVMVIFSIIVTVIGVIAPDYLRTIINTLQSVIKGEAPIESLDEVQVIFITLIGIYIIRFILDAIAALMGNYVSNIVGNSLRAQLRDKLERLPIKYYDETKTGNILSVFSNDVEIVANSLQQSLIYILTSALTVVGVLIMMFRISWQLTIIALIASTLAALIPAIKSSKLTVIEVIRNA
jgi:ATP-binding cassette subfamily B protein